jgi:polar amino acid transport system substrate-binding protein
MRRLLTTLLLCAGLCQPVQSQEQIRIAIGEWPPFIGEALPHYGVVPQLLNEAFATQGVSVEYGFFPWKRAYTEVKQGRWQASAIWGRTPEREADCLFSAVVYRDEVVLFYRRDKPISWDGSLAGAEQLNGLRIGIPLGSAKMPVLEEAERRGWVQYEASGDELINLRKLAAGRIDAVDIVKGSGSHLLRQLSAKERAKLTTTQSYETWDYHLIFSRRLPESERFQQLFDQGLRELKDSGRYAQIWQQFNSPIAP